ncbi:hypothetical protein C4M98_03240 [Mycoplasmopsis pullorum]|uniref:MAG3450 family membrane protein n=1 Tax=Mycoplasmopsis pullorum TaxID=48003 RepID=UPI00111A8858|nr:hypothetical protein [Mycoplasmopsis pullorum]TNK82175.1 hypothetical protein C4M94_01795 [Mycoplasmopsis pullorum]TNK83236.1 hypothetical protein C4M80_00955 [Mycoplasmopsis pullorum]TNK84694.1 hypothetical protein C4M92_03035 [Mycoplasmopsis pullorum]TNK85161.1 hypothetical protein C4M81_00095 [Mycoplasmopsis pullorum]TNK86228.1 hypothetical protein C4M85_00690 [Mycoplasmopsis pullorum]
MNNKNKSIINVIFIIIFCVAPAIALWLLGLGQSAILSYKWLVVSLTIWLLVTTTLWFVFLKLDWISDKKPIPALPLAYSFFTILITYPLNIYLRFAIVIIVVISSTVTSLWISNLIFDSKLESQNTKNLY